MRGIKNNTIISRERANLLVCMIIASIFWIVVKMSKTYTTERVVAIKYELPEGKAFTEMPPQEFEAKIEATGWNLMYDFFVSKRPIIEFNLNNLPTSRIDRAQMLKLINEQLSEPLEVIDVASLSKSSFGKDYIMLNYEENYEKKLPVFFDGALTFQTGYDYLDSVILVPDSVLVSGPFSLINELTHWETDHLELADLRENYTKPLLLKSPDKPQISLKPEQVEVDIAVEEYIENAVFVPVQLKNSPDSIRIFPAKVQIQFVVGMSIYNQIQADSFTLIADFKGIARNAENNTVPLVLTKQPKAVRAVNFTPKSIEFFILEEDNDKN